MYDLELNKAVEQIKENNAKTVLIQLPDGLKPKATEIVDHLEKNTKAKIYIYLNSNFGACDIPKTDVDLLIHFGHNNYF